MKVLVISDYREYISSRPEAEIFIGLKKEGLDITIMTYPGTEYKNKFKEAGINVIEFHPEKKYEKSSIAFIRKTIIEGSYQVMHLFNSKALSNGLAAAKGLPVKVVAYRGYTGHINWFDPAIYFKYFHPRVDKIVCVVKAIENLFKKNSLFVKNKAVTIQKGHDPEWYSHVQPVSSFEQYEIPKGSFVVVCTANVRPMKGIPYLLKATYDLPADKPIHFVFAGNGFDQPAIKKLITKSPFSARVHCIGYASDPLSLVAAADIFVMPSIKGEGLNKAVIEAMSLGVPPIITDIPGNEELVPDNSCGLMVRSKDSKALAEAIMQLYNNPELRKKIGDNAKNHIRVNLNIGTTIQKMKALYKKLVSGQ